MSVKPCGQQPSTTFTPTLYLTPQLVLLQILWWTNNSQTSQVLDIQKAHSLLYQSHQWQRKTRFNQRWRRYSLRKIEAALQWISTLPMYPVSHSNDNCLLDLTFGEFLVSASSGENITYFSPPRKSAHKFLTNQPKSGINSSPNATQHPNHRLQKTPQEIP